MATPRSLAKLLPGFPKNTDAVRKVSATYDFAVNGGAIGTISTGRYVPKGALILGGVVDVDTTCTTAGADAGTMAIQAQAANDIVAAIAVADASNPWDAGKHDVIPDGTGSTAVEVNGSDKEIKFVIAAQVFTAGKFTVHLLYVLP